MRLDGMMAEGSWEVAVAEARAGGADERSLAFERLTAGRLERAYRLASAVLEDDAEAQDAVHDAGLRAWARWSELRDPARFDAWFDRIVVNACRGRQGRRRRLRAVTIDGLADGPAPDALAASPERDALRRALAALTPEHRLVILLHHVEDLPIAEIAERTGERQGTVKSRLHYALRELRAAYEAEERRPSPDREQAGAGGRR